METVPGRVSNLDIPGYVTLSSCSIAISRRSHARSDRYALTSIAFHIEGRTYNTPGQVTLSALWYNAMAADRNHDV